MLRAPAMRMARKIDDVPLYRKACEFSVAVSALLRKPGLCKDVKHRNQIAEALDSVEANMEEGFEQGTDRAFARYLTTSKGRGRNCRSSEESRQKGVHDARRTMPAPRTSRGIRQDAGRIHQVSARMRLEDARSLPFGCGAQ